MYYTVCLVLYEELRSNSNHVLVFSKFKSQHVRERILFYFFIFQTNLFIEKKINLKPLLKGNKPRLNICGLYKNIQIYSFVISKHIGYLSNCLYQNVNVKYFKHSC